MNLLSLFNICFEALKKSLNDISIFQTVNVEGKWFPGFGFVATISHIHTAS